MQIDDELLARLENMSVISLSAGEKTRLSKDFEQIIAAVSCLYDLDTSGVPECIYQNENSNVFREDEEGPSSAREDILRNAPVKSNEMIIAPKTVE
jgi:aspartyl-tRNA(Asn)/glutamyl-tRNA(Gln) amidotransferase subunit C